MKPAVQPIIASDGVPLTSPAIRNAATVSATIATDTSGVNRAPADTVTTQPTATAVLSEESPARAPPAAPMTASKASQTRGRSPTKFQIAQVTAETTSVTAIAMPRAPAPRCGVDNGTVTSTITSTT